VDAGAALRLEDHSIYFVCSGAGAAGGRDVSEHATLHVEGGATETITARTPVELLQLGLPWIGGGM
jgi:hypothetical protein